MIDSCIVVFLKFNRVDDGLVGQNLKDFTHDLKFDFYNIISFILYNTKLIRSSWALQV